ncbi:MAG: hypothetical protein ACKO43_02010 [Alphaproteobacteria bacterium]
MVSLFRKALCYVIVAQLVLTPLYSASAVVPVVMVSDTVAQGLLKGQLIALANLNIKLLELNNAQTATNATLTKILSSIKYQPPEGAEDVPTTDTILIEFTSSLYAAYTENSLAYNHLKDARDTTATATPTAPTTPTTTATTPATKAPTATAPRALPSVPAGGGTPPAGTGKSPFEKSFFKKFGYKYENLPVPTEGATKPPASKYGSTLDDVFTKNRESLESQKKKKPSDPLGDFANFTDFAVKLARDSARTFYNFQNLQNCGNAIDCASSGFNVVTGVLGTLKNYGINIGDANFQKNLGYVGAALSFANLVTDLFSGKFNAQKLLKFINGMQQNILFAAIAKGGLLTDDTTESKGLRIVKNLTTLLGFTVLPILDDTALGYLVFSANAFEAGNRFGPGPKAKDTPKTGALSKDTPLAGSNTPPSTPRPQTGELLNPSTAELAKFLKAMLRCNPKVATSAANCQKMENENRRFFLAELKSRCAAMAISQQQGPAKLMQEMFLGTSNPKRCDQTTMYKTKGGKELCPSINTLQSASSVAEKAVSSQLNVLIGLSMYTLVMANMNTEQVIFQNACASMGDLIAGGAPAYGAYNTQE